MTSVDPPLAVLAELTHRCPLRCPYCSNPVALEPRSGELDTSTWKRVIEESVELGAFQIHFSGGEPTARRDLEELVSHAESLDLYTNLITSGVLLDRSRLDRLKEAGLQHVQLSLQDADGAAADQVAGRADSHRSKLCVASWVKEVGLPLTINLVVHRKNLDRLDQMLQLAETLGAQRVEIAHVQYYGWALANREALLPTPEQLARATDLLELLRPTLPYVVDYVVPDYYAKRPKSCMGGWGRRFLVVSPSGKVLPCHAATTIPELRFDSVQERSLSEIWYESSAFGRFRGTDWMPEPCRGCDRKEIDWGGCRCQALALTGRAEATDPACELSPHHSQMTGLVGPGKQVSPPPFLYRGDTPKPA
jgi:pyrroloquinoline quinone biosynthesis protein E